MPPVALIADPVAALVEEASRYLEVREKPLGSNRAVEIDYWLRECGVGFGLPWCLAFLQGAGRQALGRAWPLPRRTALVQDIVDWAQPRGFVHDAAQVGDLMVLYYPSLQRYGHIGLVIERTETGVKALEGNTGRRGEREGYGVFAKERVLTDRMRFVRWLDALSRSPARSSGGPL